MAQRALGGISVRSDKNGLECAPSPVAQRALGGISARSDKNALGCALACAHSAGFPSVRTRTGSSARPLPWLSAHSAGFPSARTRMDSSAHWPERTQPDFRPRGQERARMRAGLSALNRLSVRADNTARRDPSLSAPAHPARTTASHNLEIVRRAQLAIRSVFVRRRGSAKSGLRGEKNLQLAPCSPRQPRPAQFRNRSPGEGRAQSRDCARRQRDRALRAAAAGPRPRATASRGSRRPRRR